MVRGKVKGKNYSIYFKSHQAEFIDRYIDDVSNYLQNKVEEDIADCEDFFITNIKKLEKEITNQKKLLDKATENNIKKEESTQKLIEEFSSRADIKRKESYLDGSSGKKLLREARLTKEKFKELVK